MFSKPEQELSREIELIHTLTAKEQSLAKIFSDDYVFTIPGYQRPITYAAWQDNLPAGQPASGRSER